MTNMTSLFIKSIEMKSRNVIIYKLQFQTMICLLQKELPKPCKFFGISTTFALEFKSHYQKLIFYFTGNGAIFVIRTKVFNINTSHLLNAKMRLSYSINRMIRFNDIILCLPWPSSDQSPMLIRNLYIKFSPFCLLYIIIYYYIFLPHYSRE